MHRDVKPSNILMDTQCGIHVIDFGLARRISPTQPVARSDSATISVLSAQSEDLGSLQTEQSEESAEEPSSTVTTSYSPATVDSSHCHSLVSCSRDHHSGGEYNHMV